MSFLYYEILICLTEVWNYGADKQKAEEILHRCYLQREAPSWRSNSGLWLIDQFSFFYFILF